MASPSPTPIRCVELVIVYDPMHGPTRLESWYVREDDVIFNDMAFLEMFHGYEDETTGVTKDGKKVYAVLEDLESSGRIVKYAMFSTEDGSGCAEEYFAIPDGVVVARRIVRYCASQH